VINLFSELQPVGGFLQFPPVCSTNKADRHDIVEILLKVLLNTIARIPPIILNTKEVSRGYM
jgi:hypothetical protein